MEPGENRVVPDNHFLCASCGLDPKIKKNSRSEQVSMGCSVCSWAELISCEVRENPSFKHRKYRPDPDGTHRSFCIRHKAKHRLHDSVTTCNNWRMRGIQKTIGPSAGVALGSSNPAAENPIKHTSPYEPSDCPPWLSWDILVTKVDGWQFQLMTRVVKLHWSL